MFTEKTKELKTRLHPRNKNRERYDLSLLVMDKPDLGQYVKPNKYGDDSVDFSNPRAVKLLNQAILSHYYGIKNWEFPDENLCPAIPGRADYIHYMADLLAENNFGKMPKGDKVICTDIGVGATCIYPILGIVEYGWNFIGSDIDENSLESAKTIISSNELLKDKVDLRLQKNSKDTIYGILNGEDKVDLTICNPPFHASKEDALKGSKRKVKYLSGKALENPELNFSGISQELICEGGESKFIQNMIRESEKFSRNCLWFSTLVSKQSNLRGIYRALKEYKISQIRTINMGTGNKSSRVVAWSFLSKDERKDWRETRW